MLNLGPDHGVLNGGLRSAHRKLPTFPRVARSGAIARVVTAGVGSTTAVIPARACRRAAREATRYGREPSIGPIRG
jgi:hypothetical protein